jgi:cytochrome c biogenesis protein CcmG, thiol:disulfide interchange protein DsbE
MISRRTLLTFLPVIVFAALGLLFWKGLSGDPSTLPSTLINKRAPTFALPPIEGGTVPGLATEDLAKGNVTIVNIFASWCGPCRNEHPLLMELAKRSEFRLVGINNKDAPTDANRFLNTLGNPYAAIGADTNGRVTIDWGGYGVPETFIVGGTGVVRHKIVGPLSPEIIEKILLPEIEKAKLAPSG